MSIYQALVNIVGEVPAGYEPVVYVFAIVITIYLLSCGFSLIASLFKMR